jgi:hypothetical protein
LPFFFGFSVALNAALNASVRLSNFLEAFTNDAKSLASCSNRRSISFTVRNKLSRISRFVFPSQVSFGFAMPDDTLQGRRRQ